MRHHNKKLIALSLVAGVLFGVGAQAEVSHKKIGSDIIRVRVSDDAWQPDNFKQGIIIPVTYSANEEIELDGIDNEAAWAVAKEVTVPLSFGNVEFVQLKALYTDEDVLIRIRWPDRNSFARTV